MSRSSQAFTTGSIPPRLPAPIAPCSLYRRRYSRRLGYHLQLCLHLPLRPYLATVDHRTSWTLYGSNVAAQVSDLVKHGYRPHDRGNPNPLRVAVANAKDGKACCTGMFRLGFGLCGY